MHVPKLPALSIDMSVLCPFLLTVIKVLIASPLLGFGCQGSGPAPHQHSQGSSIPQGMRGAPGQPAGWLWPTASNPCPWMGPPGPTTAGPAWGLQGPG